ncbi:MAG: hypothetical protein WC526_01220 [Patescibacteria group bacterium]
MLSEASARAAKARQFRAKNAEVTVPHREAARKLKAQMKEEKQATARNMVREEIETLADKLEAEGDKAINGVLGTIIENGDVDDLDVLKMLDGFCYLKRTELEHDKVDRSILMRDDTLRAQVKKALENYSTGVKNQKKIFDASAGFETGKEYALKEGEDAINELMSRARQNIDGLITDRINEMANEGKN